MNGFFVKETFDYTYVLLTNLEGKRYSSFLHGKNYIIDELLLFDMITFSNNIEFLDQHLRRNKRMFKLKQVSIIDHVCSYDNEAVILKVLDWIIRRKSHFYMKYKAAINTLAKKGYIRALYWFLNKYRNKMIKIYYNSDVMFYAIRDGNIRILDWLWKLKTDYGFKLKCIKPIFNACLYKRVNVLEWLWEKHLNSEFTFVISYRHVDYALTYNSVDVLLWILEKTSKLQLDLNIKNGVRSACKRGNVEALRYLRDYYIRTGTKVKTRYFKFKESIYNAANNANIECLDLLWDIHEYILSYNKNHRFNYGNLYFNYTNNDNYIKVLNWFREKHINKNLKFNVTRMTDLKQIRISYGNEDI
jgi:hypothetical protein